MTTIFLIIAMVLFSRVMESGRFNSPQYPKVSTRVSNNIFRAKRRKEKRKRSFQRRKRKNVWVLDVC